jgi:hypothetical protein
MQHCLGGCSKVTHIALYIFGSCVVMRRTSAKHSGKVICIARSATAAVVLLVLSLWQSNAVAMAFAYVYWLDALTLHTVQLLCKRSCAAFIRTGLPRHCLLPLPPPLVVLLVATCIDSQGMPSFCAALQHLTGQCCPG